MGHIFLVYRVYGFGQARSGLGHVTRSVSEQEMGVQLVGVGPGTDHVQILGTLRRPPQVPHRERRVVSVQEHVPVCECWVFGASDKVKV